MRLELTDTLPAGALAKLGLPVFAEAVRLLHAPPPDCVLEQLESRQHPAWRRVQFDELLAQQLSLRRAYTARRAVGAPAQTAFPQQLQSCHVTMPLDLRAPLPGLVWGAAKAHVVLARRRP